MSLLQEREVRNSWFTAKVNRPEFEEAWTAEGLRAADTAWSPSFVRHIIDFGRLFWSVDRRGRNLCRDEPLLSRVDRWCNLNLRRLDWWVHRIGGRGDGSKDEEGEAILIFWARGVDGAGGWAHGLAGSVNGSVRRFGSHGWLEGCGVKGRNGCENCWVVGMRLIAKGISSFIYKQKISIANGRIRWYHTWIAASAIRQSCWLLLRTHLTLQGAAITNWRNAAWLTRRRVYIRRGIEKRRKDKMSQQLEPL